MTTIIKKRGWVALAAVLMMLAMALPATALADTATVTIKGGSYAADGTFITADWVTGYTYTYQSRNGDTAWDAFKAALDSNGYAYSVANSQYGFYLNAIGPSYPLSWLYNCSSQDSNQQYGYNYWLFKVNSAEASVGVSNYTLQNGDKLVWVYSAPAKAQTHTITFETNGGSLVGAMTVIDQQNFSAPTAPTKDGSVFAGWYTDSTLATPVDWTKTLTADATYYAKWNDSSRDVYVTIVGGSWSADGIFTASSWTSEVSTGYADTSTAWNAFKNVLDKNSIVYNITTSGNDVYINSLSKGTTTLGMTTAGSLYNFWSFSVNGNGRT